MDILRTPASRFERLPDFDYEPHTTIVDDLQIVHVEAGEARADPVLLLHGEPTWSFLYRHMIPSLAEAGLRPIAPDFVGFGRSDKLAAIEDYTYQRHIDWMKTWIMTQDLKRITLFGQDWGTLIGLRLAVELPDRFDRIVIANGFLPTGDQRMPLAFRLWHAFAHYSPLFPVGAILQFGTQSHLSRGVRDGYKAPFPNESFKAGARAFPLIVPTSPNDPQTKPNRKTWRALRRWEKPFLTAFGDRDPIMRGADEFFQRLIPGARGQKHTVLKGAGHFIQEERGAELSQVVIDFVHATRTV